MCRCPWFKKLYLVIDSPAFHCASVYRSKAYFYYICDLVSACKKWVALEFRTRASQQEQNKHLNRFWGFDKLYHDARLDVHCFFLLPLWFSKTQTTFDLNVKYRGGL